MPTFDQAWQIGQTVFLVLLAAGGAWAAWQQNRKKRPTADGKPAEKVPGDVLAKPHPDPEVQRLIAEVNRLAERAEAQQKELTEMSKELGTLRAEVRRADDRSYLLQRIVRRFIDAWPHGRQMPHLTPEEWDLIGIDEDTTPGSRTQKPA